MKAETESPEFLLFYSRVLLREYRARKHGPLQKTAHANLLVWARRAKRRYWLATRPAQGDLFGGARP